MLNEVEVGRVPPASGRAIRSKSVSAQPAALRAFRYYPSRKKMFYHLPETQGRQRHEDTRKFPVSNY
jgi:hypothetical protein